MVDTEKVEDISQIIVAAKLLGKIIGVSDSYIRQLANEGLLTKIIFNIKSKLLTS